MPVVTHYEIRERPSVTGVGRGRGHRSERPLCRIVIAKHGLHFAHGSLDVVDRDGQKVSVSPDILMQLRKQAEEV